MLTTTCVICGMTRKYKNLLYDNQLGAYCASPYQCTANHPNSIANIKKRGTLMEFYTPEEAESISQQKTDAIYKASAHQYNRRTRDVDTERLTQTLSFRVRTAQQADYLAHLMAREGINKVSQAVHYLINFAIERDPSFNSKAIVAAISPYKPIDKKNKVSIEKPKPPTPDDEVFTI